MRYWIEETEEMRLKCSCFRFLDKLVGSYARTHTHFGFSLWQPARSFFLSLLISLSFRSSSFSLILFSFLFVLFIHPIVYEFECNWKSISRKFQSFPSLEHTSRSSEKQHLRIDGGNSLAFSYTWKQRTS